MPKSIFDVAMEIKDRTKGIAGYTVVVDPMMDSILILTGDRELGGLISRKAVDDNLYLMHAQNIVNGMRESERKKIDARQAP